jgi:hypothetical protein
VQYGDLRQSPEGQVLSETVEGFVRCYSKIEDSSGRNFDDSWRTSSRMRYVTSDCGVPSNTALNHGKVYAGIAMMITGTTKGIAEVY